MSATGHPAVATRLADHLTAVGVVVGRVRRMADAASAIEYPKAQLAEARTLAKALAQAPLLTPADVPHITLVLGATDPSGLLAALRAFDGLPCAR